VGISAESWAAAFLIAKGFRILARRWRSPLGEIDIVAKRRHLLFLPRSRPAPALPKPLNRSMSGNADGLPQPPRSGWPQTPTKQFSTSDLTRSSSCEITPSYPGRFSKQADQALKRSKN
jgi:Uncharacterised protein family UPF0102